MTLTVLHDETVTPAIQTRIRQVTEKFSKLGVRFMSVTLPSVLRGLNFGAFTPASLYRLMIPQLFPREELVIYLDTDLVFNGIDIAELAATVPKDAALSGVLDPYIHLTSEHLAQQERLALDSASYINSGVLAFRPTLLLGNLMEEFLAFGRRFGAVSHPDQDFLNHRFKSQIHLLPPEFNLQACTYNRSLLQPLSHYQGKVVHYAGRLKPQDGMMAPGFVPFWRHTFLVPEVARASPPDHVLRYLFPIEGDPHGLRRMVMREQPGPAR